MAIAAAAASALAPNGTESPFAVLVFVETPRVIAVVQLGVNMGGKFLGNIERRGYVASEVSSRQMGSG